MGRKAKEVDPEGVQRLASYGCTRQQIADYFGCSCSLIDHKYAKDWQLGRATLQKNILMWQVRNAKKGSDTMLIHLGKHHCGQTEKNTAQEPLEDLPATDDNSNPTEP